MEIEQLEENSHFRAVVKDAIKELKNNGSAYVFFQNQVDAVQKILNQEVEVKYDGDFYRLRIKNNKKNKKKDII